MSAMDLPKEETGGKKKKQKKPKQSKTLPLNDFLADASTGTKYAKDPPKRTGSWADAMEERLDAEGEVSTSWQGGGGGGARFDRSQLPSAPRKAQARNIDMSRLPKAPPYTVYLGNLSYECNEDDIFYFFQRKNLKVKEIRLPTDSGTSRLKGFGYAELESISGLVEALELSGENLRNRAVTIDLATSKSADGDGPRGDRYRRDSEDRTSSDWRRGPAEDGYSPPRDYQNGPEPYGGDGPRGGRGYGDDYRGGGYNRGGGGYDRGGGGGYDRGGGGGYDRGGGGGYDRGGGGGGYDRGGGGGGYDRGGGGYDRGGGGGYDRGGGGGYDGRARRGYGSGGWNERPEYRRHGDSDGGYGRRRPNEWSDRRGPPQHSDDGGRGRSPPLRAVPQERPRLQLQPRSKQTESDSGGRCSSIFGAARPVDTASREQEIELKLQRERERAAEEKERALKEKEMREGREKVSVFGGARPVDTASREKEIEEKLRRQEEELAQRTKRERRGSDRERIGSDRERRGSDRERRGSDRERIGSDREWLPEEGKRQGHGRCSRSPEGHSQGREDGQRERERTGGNDVTNDNKLQQGSPAHSHELPMEDNTLPNAERDRSGGDQGRGQDGGSERKHIPERGRQDHSDEDQREWDRGGRGRRRGGWKDGEGRGQRPQGRGKVVESSDREQGSEVGREWKGVSRRGGGRGGRGGGRKEGEKREPRVDREKWKGPPSDDGWHRGREDGPMRKYEEPAQPTFSQPSRYAMLDMEDNEQSPSNEKAEEPEASKSADD